MKRVILPILFSLLLTTSLFGQKMGSWETLFSYENNPSYICDAGDKVYAVTDGKLFSYNAGDKSLEIYIKQDSGNDSIQIISYNSSTDKLLIIRSNSDIDILDKSGNFFNIPFLKDALQNINKGINSIRMNGDLAYVSTNFGLLTINMARNEVKETCIFNFVIYASCVHNDILYIASENGVKTVSTKENIQELSKWTTLDISSKNPFSDLRFSDKDIRDLAFFKDKLHLFVPGNAIYILDGESLDRTLAYGSPRHMNSTGNDKLLAYSGSTLWPFSDIKTYYSIDSSSDKLFQTIEPRRSNTSQFWVSIDKMHLSLIEVKDPDSRQYAFVDSHTYIKPDGPLSNYPFYVAHDGKKLMMVGGGFYANRKKYPAILGEYKDDKWFNYDKQEIDDKLATIDPEIGEALDFSSVISDPSDPSHLFVGSWGEGVYEFKDHKFEGIYNLETFASNVGANELPKNYIRVNGLSYDKYGNLWAMSTATNDLISVKKKDGGWIKPTPTYQSLTTPAISKTNIGKRIIIDKYNRKWTLAQRAIPFLFVFDDNNTIENTRDDNFIYQTSFIDQDYKSISIDQLYDIVEDLNGNIWIASSAGPFIIYNSSNLFNKTSLTLNKIKIPRNDGTNTADILLENTIINTIAVDGANRKWIGTESSGIFLVSENGQETIHNFTNKNSPMPSNNVISIAIDPNTGVVYIGTDKGLLSYVSDATTGSADYSNVYAYPNPVRPEYDGLITISGLQINSNVKITDVKGNLINQGKSQGGLYTWDGRNVSGNKVDTGTYLVFGSSEDSQTGVVTKILIVK